MKAITPFGPLNTPADFARALQAIAQASNENDTRQIAGNFTITGAYTTTRTLNVATATLPDLLAVFATFISDLQKGGANRTQ